MPKNYPCQDHDKKLGMLDAESRRQWIEMSKMEGRVNKNTDNEIEKLKINVNENKDIIRQHRKSMEGLNDKVDNIDKKVGKIDTDVTWLKWWIKVTAGAAIASLIATIINLIGKL